MPDDLGVGAQLDRAGGGRVEDHARRAPHDLLHQRDVGLDPIVGALQQDGVVHGRDEGQAVSRAPDAGEPEYVGGGRLHRKIADRALVKFEIPVAHCQPNTVCIMPLSSEWCSQSSDQCQYCENSPR